MLEQIEICYYIPLGCLLISNLTLILQPEHQSTSPQSNVHSSSDSESEWLSETNSFVSDEEQSGENSSVASDREEASESSSSSSEEQPLSPVLSSSLSVINTHEEELIQNSPTSESLHGGIKVSHFE